MSDYLIIPIFWGQPYLPNTPPQWSVGSTPFTPQQFTDALTAIADSGYFSGLSQYRVGTVRINPTVVQQLPLPGAVPGQFVSEFTDNDSINFIRQSFNQGVPSPDQVVAGGAKPMYIAMSPNGSAHLIGSVVDTVATAAHGVFQEFPFIPVLWAWVPVQRNINDTMRAMTHEIVEALGDDGSAPGELCDSCQKVNPGGVQGAGGISVETYLDALNQNACIAPPFFPSGAPFIIDKILVPELSPASPALASFNNRLYLAWRGDASTRLSVMDSADNGNTFGNKFISPETSAQGPALCAHNGNLFIAWKGDGNNTLSVAKVSIAGNTITRFVDKILVPELSPASPALASFNNRLYLAWRGDASTHLSVMDSADNGNTFGNKFISPETSAQGPALCAHNGNLFIAWKGDGNNTLSVAKVSA